MKKVSELEGPELDYWVARALGHIHIGAITINNDIYCRSGMNDWWKLEGEAKPFCGPCYNFPLHYSTEWERGGPIIEIERIGIEFYGEYWGAEPRTGRGHTIQVPDAGFLDGQCDLCAIGPTPLIAAMRVFVMLKLGKQVG